MIKVSADTIRLLSNILKYWKDIWYTARYYTKTSGERLEVNGGNWIPGDITDEEMEGLYGRRLDDPYNREYFLGFQRAAGLFCGFLDKEIICSILQYGEVEQDEPNESDDNLDSQEKGKNSM